MRAIGKSLTIVVVAGQLVGEAVRVGGGGQHEGEPQKEGGVLGQGPVRPLHVPGAGRQVGAAARRVAHANALSCKKKGTENRKKNI